jgi:hypothetical protein
VDCLSEDERAAGAAGGLGVVLIVVQGLFLFDCDVTKLCGIKDFSAGLTLNKLDIFLSGDDFDDGVFARGGHVGWEGSNGKDFARPAEPCQLGFVQVFMVTM